MGLVVHRDRLNPQLCEKLVGMCPFGAISLDGKGGVDIGMACKLCKACVRKSDGAITFEDEKPTTEKTAVDKSLYRGILVLCEHFHGKVHDVTFELLGKARELASVTGHPVMALVIGSGVASMAQELLHYGAEEVYVYDDPALENFMIEPYTNVFESFIKEMRPSSILVGATNIGRSLAPRIAARLGCGLTADCTALEMNENTDLVQIRPAFGGNIMARIVSPNTRPQFCTVRYKVFPKPERKEFAEGSVPEDGCKVHMMPVTPAMLKCRTSIVDIVEKPAALDISEASILVQVGRGVKSKKDLAMVQELANALGATIACTRPLVENGWFDARHQIGLSGRTVKPKLLICLGVSGAIQTVAGMKGSDCIIAVNSDPQAPIFDVATYGFVGDLYEMVPMLLERLEAAGDILPITSKEALGKEVLK